MFLFSSKFAQQAVGIIGNVVSNYIPQPMPPRTTYAVAQENESEEMRQFRRVFQQIAGDDMEVSPNELRGVLNKVIAKHTDLKTDGFSLDSCKSMVAVMDSDCTGKLGLMEFQYLWNCIKNFQVVYKKFDTDRSGTISCDELPAALRAAGFDLPDDVLKLITRRYADEGGHMNFDNFICCLVRMDAMIRAFKALDKDNNGYIRSDIQDFLQLVMYS